MDVDNTGLISEIGRRDLGRAVPASWRQAFAAAYSETSPILLLLGAYALAAIAVSAILHVSLLTSLLEYAKIGALIAEVGASLGVLALLLSIAVRERSRNPARRLVEKVLLLLQPTRLAQALFLVGSFLALQAIYLFFKPLIPRFAAFAWDPALARLDRMLLLGHDAWSVLWPLFGNPPAMLVINIVYHLWFFWLVMTVVLVAFANGHRTANVRFFFAFVLTWMIGGTLLATAFSSVGPCYYGFIYPGVDPFKPLLAGLHAINEHVPVFALGVQEMLWDGQMNPGPDKLSGISAMPSMHLGTAFLLTRIAFVHDRRLGYASAAAGGMIFIGSVLLAWHYAVDGIAGALVAWIAWIVAGLVLEQRKRTALLARS